MIRATLACGIFSLLFPVVLSAKEIPVRSGDHDGFTRLVLRLPDDVEWELAESEGLAKITTKGHNDGFSIDGVFNVISRDLLTDVRAFPSRLELDLSCACEIDTFVERENFLVVDISDGPPLPDRTTDFPRRFISARPASRFNFGDLLWSQFSAAENPFIEWQREPIAPEPSMEEVQLQSEAQSEFLDEIREQLLVGIGDAASRGILEAEIPDLSALLSQNLEPSAQEIYDSSEVEVTEIEPEHGNIRITSSRDVPGHTDTSDLMTNGSTCPDPMTLSVAVWGNDTPFHLQLGNLREHLYTEVGELDVNGAQQLARLYIYFGFGAEASNILSLSDELMARNSGLVDLAEIMEHGFAGNPRYVHRYSDCDSDIALWAIMASRSLSADQNINENAALRALSGLPDHLKSFIAPALSRRLAQYGKSEAAAIALRNVDLKEGSDGASADLARATLAELAGRREDAEQLISGVMSQNVLESPEAVISYIESLYLEDQAIPPDVALLVETYAFERRKGPLAKELLRSHAIAASYSDQFPKALETLQDQRALVDTDLMSSIQSLTFSALALRAEDMMFLESYFAHFPESSEGIDSQARSAVAKRLLSLGFALEAEKITSGFALDGETSDLRLHHVEALIELGRPREALASLEMLDSPEANELRARSLSQLGENAEAYRLFESAEAREDAIRSAWLSDDWVDLLAPETPILGKARSVSETPVAEIHVRNGMLELLDSTVEESSSTRAILEDLLNNVTVSE